MVRLTPGMQQYMDIKNEHPDCVVLFRMGDFYETFFEDAKTVARELQITLTARGKGESRAPLAGIPYHAIDKYLPMLVNKGYKVCIVEQIEDPKKAKGLVKRGVVRIVTPGTVISDSMLDGKSNNYIMALYKEKKFAIALADISTGEFICTELETEQELLNEIARFQPKECIIQKNADFDLKLDLFTNKYDERHFRFKNSYETLIKHFNTISLDGFGVEDKETCISAAGALLAFLNETQLTNLSYINKLRFYTNQSYMVLDTSTQRNLELIKNIRDQTTRGTLLESLDKTRTPMGGRLLRQWLNRPLLNIEKINERLDAVEELTKKTLQREELRSLLEEVYDIERLISKVNFGSVNARDLQALSRSLKTVPRIKRILIHFSSKLIKKIYDVNELIEVVEIIDKAIKDNPSSQLKEGNIIKKGYNKELDELREITSGGKTWIAELERKEKERTGIKSLRVGFNNVFGYYIEVSRANLNLVPEDYVRKQTLTNSERFITPELKEKESIILNAEERINELEYSIFQTVVADVARYTEKTQDLARKIAHLDVLISFAIVALSNNYCKPEMNDSDEIILRNSRHPVVELIEDYFVPNHVHMDNKEDNLVIITGPNMAGKSTFMRQVALIQLMAQLGSFVPADKAKLGVVDRIFTRVGAFDDLTMGQSTFMVEMNETANILNNATHKSLIILDEIGRGTSTFDGVSIAWAVAEYIHDHIKAKTLFATHYHQLNKLADKYPNVRNYNIAVKEKDDEIIFLRKILPGGTDRSYGIQVAKLAGLPKEVIERSKVIMNRLEMEDEIGDRIHKEFKIQKKEELPKKKEEKQVSLLDL